MIYLDYSATTPVEKEVIDSYVNACKNYIGNPNSLHKLGLESNKIIKAATKQIAEMLNIKENEIIYTSGSTEANNTAIKGVVEEYSNRGKKIITSPLEHSSVIGPLNYYSEKGYEIVILQLTENGEIDLEELKKELDDNTILVSIASVNSEVGIKQPIKEISEIVKKYPKCIFHSDITQSIGKEKIDLSLLDMASISSQKFYGMKGAGILYKKKNLKITPLLHGGKSTTIYRSGTPALPLIVSTSKAIRLSYENIDKKIKIVKELNKYLKEQLKQLDIYINSNNNCIPHILNISLKNIKSEVMLHALELDDIYISTNTACSKNEYSTTIMNMYNDKSRSESAIRISISHLTTKKELDIFVSSLKKNIENLGNIK